MFDPLFTIKIPNHYGAKELDQTIVLLQILKIKIRREGHRQFIKGERRDNILMSKNAL